MCAARVPKSRYYKLKSEYLYSCEAYTCNIENKGWVNLGSAKGTLYLKKTGG